MRGCNYARVNGVEHGVSVLPPFTVDSEATSPEPTVGFALVVYPNPVRERATLVLRLAERSPVAVEVVDVLGRVVLRRDAAAYGPGEHPLVLDAARWPSGVYVVRVEAGSERRSRRITVLR